MGKSGRTHFHLKGGKSQVNLIKGVGHSTSAFEREVMRRVIGLRYAGKTEDEIIEWLEETYGRDLF